MAQLRKDPNHIGNFFDTLVEGIGHRGSSFADIDGVTHDMNGNRFLFQEWKHEGETVAGGEYLGYGQRVLLEGLAKLGTVWLIVKRNDGRLGFSQPDSPRWPKLEEIITPEEYQKRYRAWWTN
jgi:hypothetical protein